MHRNTVSDYLALFGELYDPALVSPECVEAMDALRAAYGDTAAHQIIYEVHLDDDSRTADVSFRIDTEGGPIRDRWLEFDHSVYAGQSELTPCVFLDAAALGTEEGADFFCKNALPGLVGEEKAARLLPALQRLCACAEIEGGLFQVGTMDSRAPSESVRIYTNDLSGGQILSLLSSLRWQGEGEWLAQRLGEWKALAMGGSFTLSFDLYPDRISKKLGVEFQPRTKLPKTMDAIADFLMQAGFCRPEKAAALRAWVRELPLGVPYIQNDVSHIKFSVEQSEVRSVKAYLRQSDEMRFPWTRMYRKPAQMNLELTTRCPLHCPQCYVHLNTGEELPLEEALYWLREGARAGVRCVNLSGGETLCYPHLDALLRECRRLGLESAVALSGAFVTEARLREMIEAGADEIYISLNGSTKEINERTRDGYELAVQALALLQQLRFPRTAINFVMHRDNADDLPNMIALAERFEVRNLVILAFKPDAAHELKSYPTAEQLQAAAKTIRAYKGPVTVEAESCFSQLRALVGKRFFFNQNMGVLRGCGAGRDGISVDVHGRLTPCRHLDVAEETRSISKYWASSPFLNALRSVEDRREAPCRGCPLEKACLPCAAVGMKLHGALRAGMEECPLKQEG